ncbi:hypothetical protein SeMB42_g00395 [Synchytrium endobioticum]|uniref:EF-hand domain-containing protein n=1 Tax=Synchytrium endobioticum TaxID=286115 RepID=A0A507D9P8_9FUNG|nr:hypothetical protein SeLEV6574_g02549 [Synchytrium endobioticum]TPX54190.1 hypothetical protein SeMB42_g00395 [Synchytrium endobioticum]
MCPAASLSKATITPTAIVVEPAFAYVEQSANSKVIEGLLVSGQITRVAYDKLRALELQELRKPEISTQPVSATMTSSAPASPTSTLTSSSFVPRPPIDNVGSDQAGPVRDTATPALSAEWWDKDDPSELGTRNSKRRKRTSQGLFGQLRFVYRLPLLLQTLFLILVGGLIVMIPGSISVVFFVKDREAYWTQQEPTHMGIGGYPFFVFAVFITIIWTFFWGCRYFLIVLPEVVIRISDFIIGTADDGSTNIRVEHIVDYLRHIRRAVVYLLTSVVGLTSFAGIFREHVDTSTYYNWQTILTLLWTCLVWGCFVWVCEKLALQVFAVQFSRRAFAERLEDEKFAFHVLGCLNRARHRPHNSLGMVMSKSDLASDSHHGSDLDNEMVVNELEKMEKKSSRHRGEPWFKATGFSYFQRGINESTKKLGLYAKNVGGLFVGYDAGESAGIILRNLHDAKTLSRRLFVALQRGSTGVLYPNDFRPYFSNEEETMEAFRLFDKNENGDISPQEMRSTIISMYKDKLALDKSLRDGNQAMQKLDGMFKVFMTILIAFICLGIFGVNVSSFLTGLVSLWLGTLFAIGGTVKNLLEAIIFLFVTHPYDVGDVVEIDGVTYIVKEFALTSTIFRTGDGKEVIAPNPTLNTKFIYNIRRSGPMVETITLKLSSDTTEDQLNGLKESLNSFLSTQTREFNSGITPVISQLNNNNEMVVSISPQHKMNWSQGNKVARSNRFMMELIKILKDLNISFSQSSLNVKLDPTLSRDMIVGIEKSDTAISRRKSPDHKDD